VRHEAHLLRGVPAVLDEQRGFDELPGEFRAGGLAQLQWKLKRRFIGRVKGVNVT